MSDLEKQVAELTRERDALVKERDAAVERADKASAAHQGLLGDHKTLSEQVAAAKKEAAEATARADRAEKAAGSAKASGAKAASAKSAARKVAKPDWGENDVDRPKAAELLEQIEAAKEVEVVASDGQNEIRELGAFQLDGNQPFRIALQGLIANVGDGTKHGAGIGGGSMRVEGFGLFLDGKLAAYAPLLTPVGIGAGQTVSFRDAVVF